MKQKRSCLKDRHLSLDISNPPIADLAEQVDNPALHRIEWLTVEDHKAHLIGRVIFLKKLQQRSVDIA